MLETDKVFAGSVPENYDRYFVPLIFEPYAADIVRRAVALVPKAVLETAAGTGVVTRTLAPKLAKGARYIATDLNQPMLDYAAAKQPAGSPVEWRQADALALPFEDASFDLVICQFGAMFFPDRVAGYREAKARPSPGRAFPLQRLGSHRGKRLRRRRHERACRVLPRRPAAHDGAHAARLLRHRPDPPGS